MAARRPAPTKPRYDLVKAQSTNHVYISNSCAQKANELLGLESDTELRKTIVAMLRSLTADDFAHVEAMGPVGRNRTYGDVYGRLDDLGLWFIKIEYQETHDGTTVVMSCHETDELKLQRGIVLRKPTP